MITKCFKNDIMIGNERNLEKILNENKINMIISILIFLIRKTPLTRVPMKMIGKFLSGKKSAPTKELTRASSAHGNSSPW